MLAYPRITLRHKQREVFLAIYIAGPVDRYWRKLPRWINDCYEFLRKESLRGALSTMHPIIPDSKSDLEDLSADTFTKEILGRIRDCSGVIAVFLPDDSGTPVECAIAALSGKRVLLIYHDDDIKRMPRVLRNLPGIKTVRWDSEVGKLISEMDLF